MADGEPSVDEIRDQARDALSALRGLCREDDVQKA